MSRFIDKHSFLEQGVEIIPSPPDDICAICRCGLDASPEDACEYNGVTYNAERKEGAPEFDNTVIKIKLCGHMWHRGCLKLYLQSCGLVEGRCPMDRTQLFENTLTESVRQRLGEFRSAIQSYQARTNIMSKARMQLRKERWPADLKRMLDLFDDCRRGDRILSRVLWELRDPRSNFFRHDNHWLQQLNIAVRILARSGKEETVMQFLVRNRERELKQSATPFPEPEVAIERPSSIKYEINGLFARLREFDPRLVTGSWVRYRKNLKEKILDFERNMARLRLKEERECLEYVDGLHEMMSIVDDYINAIGH
ncbi:hypothetical protein K491DRAFT_693971 [Lophiostoma macrostomum CBS 122681]|uniref:RING-type domain-containing protein n=1 Tax=Lophiostoma macrostomum CBS 122681 TaxID=1314788 RepID=A0A6A6T671_9PLEO|nr:hypothetical protein K491DRAFT_693971 [Lophiostoma macrostomum CBS 122681]